MEIKRKALYKASRNAFVAHCGKIIAFEDTKQIQSFKRKYFNLYSALRLPEECMYSRTIVMSDKTVPYEFIPPSELRARNEFWTKYFENGEQFEEGDVEPYGKECPYISLD